MVVDRKHSSKKSNTGTKLREKGREKLKMNKRKNTSIRKQKRLPKNQVLDGNKVSNQWVSF